MDKRVCFCLFVCQFLSTSGGTDENYCHFKGYRKNVLHMCLDGSTSGRVVAMDASNITGNNCKCILTRVNSSLPVLVLDLNYISSNIYRQDVEFYVDGKEEKKKIQTGRKALTVNRTSMELLAERNTTNRELRRSLNCLVIALSPSETEAQLYLTCYGVKTDVPNITSSPNNQPVQYNTTTVGTSTARKHTSSASPYTTVLSKSFTQLKQTTVHQSTDRLNVTVVISAMNTLSGVIQEATTSDESTQSVGVEGEPSKDSKSNVTGIIAGIITAVVILAVVVVVVISIGVICYFKRRKRIALSKENTPSKPKEGDEEEYEITENDMYIPTIMVEEIKASDVQRDSDHVYAEPDVDLKRYTDNLQEKEPLLLKQNETPDIHQDKITLNNTEYSESNGAIVVDITGGVNGVTVLSDDFPLYSQIDKCRKKTVDLEENQNA